MSYSQVLKRSWKILWQSKALWIFGILLALTTANGFFFMLNLDDSPPVLQNTIMLSQDARIRFPGSGVTVDLTDLGNPVLKIDQEEFRNLEDLFVVSPEFITDTWVILSILAVVVLFGIGLSILLRFTSEAALIKMVDKGEEQGSGMSVGEGLRAGWSRLAWRLFLIDLAVYIPVTLVMGAIFALAVSPLLLWTSGNTTAGVIGTLSSLSLLALFGLLAFLVSLLLSPLMPLFRRASIVEGLGVWASIRRGFGVLRAHFVDVLAIWFTWLGIRLAWILAFIPAVILLFPVWILFLILGVLIAAVPALLAAGIASLFVSSISAWIIAIIVGLPVFLLILALPIAFFGGMVEVYKSSMWTLTYRELKAKELTSPETSSMTRDTDLKTVTVS